MSSQSDRLMIEHLDNAVKKLTEENEDLRERIERQAAYHDSEVAALQATIRAHKRQARVDEERITRLVQAALS